MIIDINKYQNFGPCKLNELKYNPIHIYHYGTARHFITTIKRQEFNFFKPFFSFNRPRNLEKKR